MPFLDQPLIARVIQRVKPVASEIIVTTNHPEAYQFLGLPLFTDIFPARGALGGLYTALASATSPQVAVLACDMPFASPQLIQFQQRILHNENVDVVIPAGEDGLEPLHALFRRETCLPAILKAIHADKWRLISWFGDVRIRELTPEDCAPYTSAGLAFFNLNTPEDFNRAEQIARSSPI